MIRQMLIDEQVSKWKSKIALKMLKSKISKHIKVCIQLCNLQVFMELNWHLCYLGSQPINSIELVLVGKLYVNILEMK